MVHVIAPQSASYGISEYNRRHRAARAAGVTQHGIVFHMRSEMADLIFDVFSYCVLPDFQTCNYPNKLFPRQRRFIYRVSALAFWTTYLILRLSIGHSSKSAPRSFSPEVHTSLPHKKYQRVKRTALPRPPSGCCVDILLFQS